MRICAGDSQFTSAGPQNTSGTNSGARPGSRLWACPAFGAASSGLDNFNALRPAFTRYPAKTGQQEVLGEKSALPQMLLKDGQHGLLREHHDNANSTTSIARVLMTVCRFMWPYLLLLAPRLPLR
jgi:hypothetical protein